MPFVIFLCLFVMAMPVSAAIGGELSVELPGNFRAQPGNNPDRGIESYTLPLDGAKHNINFHADREVQDIPEEVCSPKDKECLVQNALRSIEARLIASKAIMQLDRPNARNLDTKLSQADPSMFPHDLCKGMAFSSVLSPDVSGRVKSKFYVRGVTVFCGFFGPENTYWTTAATVSENALNREDLMQQTEFEFRAREILKSLKF